MPCPQGTLLPPELRHRCRTNVTDLRHRLTALSREQSIYSQRHSARAGREACPTVPPPDAPSTRQPCAFGMRQHARRQGSQRLLIAKTDAIFRRIPVAPRLGITRHPERVALWQGVVAGQRNWASQPHCPGHQQAGVSALCVLAGAQLSYFGKIGVGAGRAVPAISAASKDPNSRAVPSSCPSTSSNEAAAVGMTGCTNNATRRTTSSVT